MSDIMKTIEAMNKKGFRAIYAANSSEARKYVLSVIDKNESVGAGGSVTLDQTRIIEALVNRGNSVFSTMLARRTGADFARTREEGFNAGVFLTSSNAVTVEGDLINIDKLGNRVAAMIYGPKKVIVVAGRNKLVSDPIAAVERIKSIACPQNARRLEINTPCAKTGKCMECSGTNRMCNVIVRLQYPTSGKEVHVVLVDEDLGY